ncbi:MAG: OmpH family outer membrane protein [Bacteroidota bacterium]
MKTVLVFILTLFTAGAFAQDGQKLGYADWNVIFGQMPEAKQVENALKVHNDQLRAQLDAKYKEYEAKLKAYQEGGAKMLDAVRRDKETELTQLQESMQKFQQDAQASLEKKQSDLMAPVFEKVGKAIDAVAKENGYSYVFTAKTLGGDDVLLYSDEKYNVSLLVLKKLGVTPAVAATK